MPLTIVGLGPGPIDQLTQEARDTLAAADHVWLRTRVHPLVAALHLPAPITSFDDEYEAAPDFAVLYERIADRLVSLASAEARHVYAVPGHPLVGEATVRLALSRITPPPRIVAGVSFLEPVLTACGIDPLHEPTLVSDALDPVIHPDAVGVYGQVYDGAIASHLKLALLRQYPPDHPVLVVRHGHPSLETPLAELDHQPVFDHLTTVVVPRPALIDAAGSFEALVEVVRRLRAPDGCPWDREQTNQSITRYLVEETYEAIDALDSGDMGAFAGELGDVLLQVLLHAQIADDDGHFDHHDVLAGITQKLIRRHPHVFGDAVAETARDVEVNWDALKRQEQEQEPDRGLLDRVPRSLPALAQAQDLRDRAARVGFDWQDRDGVLAKVREELAEYLQAEPGPDREEELGDLLFTLVNLASWEGILAEPALRAATVKFRERFSHVERRAREEGVPLEEAGLERMDAWWNEARLADKQRDTP